MVISEILCALSVSPLSHNHFFRHQSPAENIDSFLCYGKLFQQHSSRYCTYFTLAFYLPIHDIDLYTISFINVRASPIGWFKWRPSVCLYRVVVNVPECGRVHCVHLHSDSVTLNKEMNSTFTCPIYNRHICVLRITSESTSINSFTQNMEEVSYSEASGHLNMKRCSARKNLSF